MKPRISMRTALWIVAIVAILSAWMADRFRLEARHQLELSRKISKANARAAILEARVRANMQAATLWETESRRQKNN